MDLGTPHGLSVSSEESCGNVEFPTEIDGSRRKWSLGFRKKLTGPDWGRGLWGRRYGCGGRSCGSVRTHRDTYGPPGALWGPMGALSHFSQFSGFGPGPVPWRVSVVARGEQSVPIEQKRHGHISCMGRPREWPTWGWVAMCMELLGLRLRVNKAQETSLRTWPRS